MSDIDSDDLNQSRGGDRLEDTADDEEEMTKRYTVDLPKVSSSFDSAVGVA